MNIVEYEISDFPNNHEGEQQKCFLTTVSEACVLTLFINAQIANFPVQSCCPQARYFDDSFC